MEVIIYIVILICGLALGWARGVSAGYNVGYNEKHGKIFNLEIDDTKEGVVLFYDLAKNSKFLFQMATVSDGVNEMASRLPENVTIIATRIDPEE